MQLRIGLLICSLVFVTSCATTNVKLQGAGQGEPSTFTLACSNPPFPNPSADSDIDSCPNTGNPGNDAALSDEYASKNALCVPGPPVNVSIHTFARLQAAAEKRNIPYGGPGVRITDRSVLEALTKVKETPVGEGSLVRVVGHVTEVTKTYDKASNGEGVNCNRSGPENNDIHINVGPTDKSLPCEGIVVEMIPHHRPAGWTSAVARALVHGPAVRVTGHVFFDGRHGLFACDEQGTPRRMSLFEIHPVYTFDVCINDSDAQCDVNDDSVWADLGAIQ